MPSPPSSQRPAAPFPPLAWLCCLCCLALLLAACQRYDTPAPAPQPAPATTPAPSLPTLLPTTPPLPQPRLDGVYLSARLPASTIAYLRLPNPWHLLGDVVGRSTDRAFGNKTWRDQLDALRAAAQDGARRQAWATGFGSVLALVDGPIELALLDGDRLLGADSSVLLSTSLNTASLAEVSRLVSESATWLSGQPPAPVLIDAQGYGEMDIGLAQPLRLQFRAEEQRLYMHWGQDADLDAFARLLAQLGVSGGRHRAQTQIEAADASGRGLLLWTDLKALAPWLQAREDGWRQLPRLAGSALLAAGSVNGHGQLTLALDELDPELLARLPKTAAAVPVTTAGQPQWALLLALPTRAEWEAVRRWLDDPAATAPIAANPSAPSPSSADPSSADPSTSAAGSMPSRPPLPNPLDQLDAWLRQSVGVNAATVFDRVGPELVLWQDAAGHFAALRVRNQEGFDSLLAHLNGTLAGRRGFRRWNGLDVHEFSLPPLAVRQLVDNATAASSSPDAADDSAATRPEAAGTMRADAGLQASLAAMRWRSYWIEEGPYQVHAAVPQSLVDRQSSRDKFDLQRWLEDTQSTPATGSLLLYSASISELPRDSYHRMIRALQAVGDLLGSEVDPFAFPNADEVALPQQGAVSLRLGVDGRRLSLSLRYEDQPLELLARPWGLVAAATTGWLAQRAGIALQRHRARLLGADAIAASAALRQAVDAFHQRRQRLPRQWAELGRDAPALALGPGLGVAPGPGAGSGSALAATDVDAAATAAADAPPAHWPDAAQQALAASTLAWRDAALEIRFADDPALPQPLRQRRLMLRRDDDGHWHCVAQPQDAEDALAEGIAADACRQLQR